MAAANTLILIEGQEGAGKSTLVRALVPHTPNSVKIDGEDLGQTNPCPMDGPFFELMRANILALIHNYWRAGYTHVIAGSFLNNYQDYTLFRAGLPEDTRIYFVHLCAAREVRDQRRIERAKPTSAAWRDWVDEHYPEETSFKNDQADYRYIRIDSSDLTVDETLAAIKDAIPEVYPDE
jgi:energy-coupling factor transporter ATP-binding protein EcfA2